MVPEIIRGAPQRPPLGPLNGKKAWPEQSLEEVFLFGYSDKLICLRLKAVKYAI